MTATEIETEAPEAQEFTTPMPWYGVLAPEGVKTGDHRRFAAGSLRHRDLPISLAWQPSDFGGHDGAVIVANIQRIWRQDGLVMGSGEFSTTEDDADRVVNLIAEGMLKGVSVDLDDVTASYAADEDDPEVEIEEVQDGRISSATIVRIPAFAEAFIALGYPPDTAEGRALSAAGCLPCELLRQDTVELASVSDKPWSDFTAADYTDDQWFAATALHTNGDSRVKGDNKLPYKEPSGTINRNGVHAAAARFNQTEGPAEAKAAAKSKLRGAYGQLGEEVPEVLQAAVDEVTTFALDEFAAVGDHVRWLDQDGDPEGEGEIKTGVVESIDGDMATVIEDSDDDEGGDTYQVPVADLEPVKEKPADDNERPAFLDEESVDAAEFAPGTRDGPGWLTNPDDSQRLRNYWTRGAGAAKIRWGVPGDFNRCRRQLAKYIANPQWLAGTCANLHKVAIGVWPGQESSAETMVAAAPAYTLVADAQRPHAAPLEWFTDPQLNQPTPLTIDEDGRIYGHAALWETCHIGFKGICRTAPHSNSGYAQFLLGGYRTAEGELVRVGTITLGTGHADPHLNAASAVGHYDNTGTQGAYVNAGEDEHGIWVSGAVAPGLSDADRVKLQAAKLSGDWRPYGNELDMVAVLAVNVPGFPIPRPALAASGDQQLSLVAAGIVPDRTVESPAPTPADLARMVARELARMQVRRDAASAARKVFAAERADRAQQARRILEGAR